MWRPEPRADSGSLGCPDLLQHVPAPHSPSSSEYLSFFEDECRAIVARLRSEEAEDLSPIPGELRALQPEPAGAATSTPLHVPSHGWVPDSSGGDGGAAAAPGPAPREPECLPQPAAGGGPGARPRPSGALPPAQSRRARRGPAQPSGSGPGSPARSPGRGRARLALPCARASLGLQSPAAGTGRGARETRLLRPPVSVKAGSRQQPSRLSTAVPTVASRSSLRPPGKVVSSKRFCPSNGSATQELVCNRTREMEENGESKETLIAAGTVLEAGKNNQTWVCVESSLSRELAPGPNSGCEDAVPAEQSAGDQLFQELKRVKEELERAKAELADKTAQCEAYQQIISSSRLSSEQQESV